MSDPAIDRLTLREKLIHAEKTTRELVDHLDRGLIPKVHSLRRLVRHRGAVEHQDEVKDATVRNAVREVLQADSYTRSLYDRERQLLSAIEQEVSALIGNQ